MSRCIYCCAECHYAECHFAECRDLFIFVMLNVIMLNVIMLSVVMLNVIMLSDVAPFCISLAISLFLKPRVFFLGMRLDATTHTRFMRLCFVYIKFFINSNLGH